MHKVPLFFWFDILLEARAEILEKISLVFLSKRWDQKDILKLTDLWHSISMNVITQRDQEKRAHFQKVEKI